MRIALTSMVVLAACSTGTLETPDPVDRPTEEGEYTPVGPVDVTEDSQMGRDFRRMDIDQLSASIERVTGHRWVREDGRGETIDRFEELAPTLGVPDYIEVVADALEPSLLFQKFLNDAALDVCPALVADDLGRADGQRWLMPQTGVNTTWTSDASAIETTVQDAVLRFHGKALAPESEAFAEWVFLIRSLEQISDSPTARWEAVCTALITHPDFYLY